MIIHRTSDISSRANIRWTRLAWLIRTYFRKPGEPSGQFIDSCARRISIYRQLLSSYTLCSGRSPYGERGLKLDAQFFGVAQRRSLPIRGAWVEINLSQADDYLYRSLPIRGAWVEMTLLARMPSGSFGRSPYVERGLK